MNVGLIYLAENHLAVNSDSISKETLKENIEMIQLSVKNGFSNHIQRHKCREYKRTFQTEYLYRACHKDINGNITDLIKESCDIRSIDRILRISTTQLPTLYSIGSFIQYA